MDYEIVDGGLSDDLTFNDSNQIVIDCVCTNNPTLDVPVNGSLRVWAVHVTGLWDPIQGKFVKVSYVRVASPK